MFATIPKISIILLWLSFILLACKPNQVETPDSFVEISQPIPDGIPLIIKRNKVALRKEPGVRSELVEVLEKNTTVYDQGTVSKFVTFMQLNGQDYLEPWIEVSTAQNKKGWIFASSDFFEWEESLNLDERFFLDKRFRAFFGETTFSKLEAYTASIGLIENEEDWLKTFRLLSFLKEEIQQQLLRLKNEKSDFFWLTKIIPGLVVSRNEGNPPVVLYVDYRFLGTLAVQSSGRKDDELLEVFYRMYPSDSIEYKFPEWILQVEENKGHSLLGRNIHYRIFGQLEALKVKTELFDQEIGQIKKKLIADFTSPDVTFWEERQLIEKELDKIKQKDLKLLNKQDQLAIKILLESIRKGQLKNRINYKSGLRDLKNTLQ